MSEDHTLDKAWNAYEDGADARLGSIDERLARIERVAIDLERHLESWAELRRDMVPILNAAFGTASEALERWERSGAIGFVREATGIAETIATSFSDEDVRLLGQNVVAILRTVRNLTQPEVLDVADRAAHALQDADGSDRRAGLLRALGDPEVRRGATLLLAVLKELGQDRRRDPAAGIAHREQPDLVGSVA